MATRMETYKVKIVGIKPLLVHSPAGMISNQPKLRRGEHLEPKVEAETYLYKNAEGKPCIPAANVKACIRDAGRNYRVSGRRSSTFSSMIRAGIDISPPMITIISSENWTVDARSVVIQRQRIIRARPRFDSWTLQFEINNYDTTIIPADILKRILIDAGKYYGLGDFRPEFGLFKVESFRKS